MKFKIPKKLEIGGNEITVSFLDTLEDPAALGSCDLSTSSIKIALNSDTGKHSASSRQMIFCHELTHAILDTMGEFKLSGNEKFVCAFSSLLNEALKSME